MAHYSREEYAAYPEIVVIRDPALPSVQWIGRIYSYKPIGFMWQGALLEHWPDNLPQPELPEQPTTGRADLERWKADCAVILKQFPTPHHVIDQVEGFVDAVDIDEAEQEARRRSQEWVAERMANYRRQ